MIQTPPTHCPTCNAQIHQFAGFSGRYYSVDANGPVPAKCSEATTHSVALFIDTKTRELFLGYEALPGIADRQAYSLHHCLCRTDLRRFTR
jgi:hypothetical protein